MYRIAKYHMKQDLKKVLNWQLKYNKSLKDLNRLLYEIDEFEEIENNKPEKRLTFNDLKILNSINEKNIPDLKIKLNLNKPIRFVNRFKNTRLKDEDCINLSSVDDVKEYMDDNKYSHIVYYPSSQTVYIYLNEIIDRKAIRNKNAKILKSMNMKTLIDYQSLLRRGAYEIVNDKEFDEKTIITMENELNKIKNANGRSYIKNFHHISFLKIINLDGFKSDDFSFEIRYHNIPDKRSFGGDSVDLLKESIPSIVLKGCDYVGTLSKSVFRGTIERKITIDIYNAQKVINVDNLPINNEFENYVWSHGLNAFNDGNIIDNAKFIIDNPNIDLACSMYGDEVGSIGLYVKGDCRFASAYDLSSWVSIGNGRSIYEDKLEYQIYKPEDIINSRVWDDDGEEYINSEGIITNIKIIGIWARKHWQESNLLNELKELTGIKEINYI